MANKQMQSKLMLRLERRHQQFPAKIVWVGFMIFGVIIAALLAYSAYNQWFRPLPGFGH